MVDKFKDQNSQNYIQIFQFFGKIFLNFLKSKNVIDKRGQSERSCLCTDKRVVCLIQL